MIQDRALKIKLLSFYIRKFWYPQLEVDILSKQRLSSNRKLITDIDVLALFPDVSGRFSLMLGDCKTLKGTSPISRTLWMKGLMEYLSAQKAIVLLSKKVEKEHQLTATHLGVQLLSDSDFDVYSRHTADFSHNISSALADGENWDKFFQIKVQFPSLEPLFTFSKTNFWNEQSSHNKLRAGLFILNKSKGELNPDNNLHLAITLNHFSLIAIALNDIIADTFNRYLVSNSKEELDKDLKVIIWGGIENYDYLNGLRHKFANSQIGENDLTLPNWDEFIEFIRLGLEHPLGFNLLPLYLKEQAFAYLSDDAALNYAKILLDKERYLSVFALRLSEYLVRASKLPPEFAEKFLIQLS